MVNFGKYRLLYCEMLKFTIFIRENTSLSIYSYRIFAI